MGYDYYYYYDALPYASNTVTALSFGALGAIFVVYMIIVVAMVALQIIAMWKIFTKAGEEGWKSIVPVYNLITLYKISGISPWLLFIYFATFIPFIGLIAIFVLTIFQIIALAKSFGKGTGFIFGLIFLSPIFYMILGFGNAEYIGPNGEKATIDTEPIQTND